MKRSAIKPVEEKLKAFSIPPTTMDTIFERIHIIVNVQGSCKPAILPKKIDMDMVAFPLWANVDFDNCAGEGAAEPC